MASIVYKGLIDNSNGNELDDFTTQNNGAVKVNGYDTGGGETKPSYSLSAGVEQQITYPTGSSLVISSSTYWPKNQLASDSNFYALVDEASTVSNLIAFNDNSPSNDTIVRSDGGSFITDGFTVNRFITVSGSASNDTSPTASPRRYTIRDVTATTLTLDPVDSLTNENTGANVTILIPRKDKFMENDVNFQHNSFRILATYSRASAPNTEELQIKIRNPLSGFLQISPRVMAKGITTGSLAFELNTIADSLSIYNGYTMSIESTQSLTFTIDSITRFSVGMSEIIPIVV